MKSSEMTEEICSCHIISTNELVSWFKVGNPRCYCAGKPGTLRFWKRFLYGNGSKPAADVDL